MADLQGPLSCAAGMRCCSLGDFSRHLLFSVLEAELLEDSVPGEGSAPSWQMSILLLSSHGTGRDSLVSPYRTFIPSHDQI